MAKLPVSMSSMSSTFYQGPRDYTFKMFIDNILKDYADVSDRHRQEILDKTGMLQYSLAFTSPTFNKLENYEFLETLGDSTLNKAIIWYFSRRFPSINSSDGIDILTRLKIKYIQKKSFAALSEKLGFLQFISTNFNRNSVEDITNTLEDVFESFFGATELIIDDKFKIGTGYKICYKIVSRLLDKLNITIAYEDLVDSKTRLKELFDHNKHDCKYKLCKASVKHIPEGGQQVIIGTGEGYKYEDAEQIAATKSLETLKAQGFIKTIPEEYNKYCT